MDVIIRQIERGLERGFHYLAIVSSLTLPDICAALESANGQTSQPLYRAWYDAWLGPKYPDITSFDMYRLRCGTVHQGTFGPPGMQYERIVFMIRGKGSFIHCNIVDNVLQLDSERFCHDMIESVKSWYNAKANDPNVQTNMPRVLQFRPNGLPPHFVGMPVIA